MTPSAAQLRSVMRQLHILLIIIAVTGRNVAGQGYRVNGGVLVSRYPHAMHAAAQTVLLATARHSPMTGL